MDAELKKRWVAALRSGEFKQGRGLLRDGDQYCCLGVLCSVAGIPISEDGSDALTDDGKSGAYAPIRDVLGEKASPFDLAMMNDMDRKSFAQIADYIEEHL
jgi:hypothetical protein